MSPMSSDYYCCSKIREAQKNNRERTEPLYGAHSVVGQGF